MSFNKITKICLFVFVLFFYPGELMSYTQDDDLGYWQDDYTDTTGIDSNSNCSVSGGKLILDESSPGVYYPSGYIITHEIIPEVLINYNQVEWEGIYPEGTEVKIQFVTGDDNLMYDDNDFEGNSEGFTTSPVNISDFDLLDMPDNLTFFDEPGKSFKFALKITLSTSDTGVTPELDWTKVSWNIPSDSLEMGEIAMSSKPGVFGGRGNSNYYEYESLKYPVIVNSYESTSSERSRIYEDQEGNIILKADGSLFNGTNAEIVKLTKSLNEVWKTQYWPWGNGGSGETISSQGGVALVDATNDFTAYYNSNGEMVWFRNHNESMGHSSIGVFNNDHFYHSWKKPNGEGNLNYFYKIDNNGEVDSPWPHETDFDTETGSNVSVYKVVNTVIDSDGNIYAIFSDYDSDPSVLMSLDQDSSLRWRKYNEDYFYDNIAISDDNVIYITATSISTDKIVILKYDTSGNKIDEIDTGLEFDYDKHSGVSNFVLSSFDMASGQVLIKSSQYKIFSLSSWYSSWQEALVDTTDGSVIFTRTLEPDGFFAEDKVSMSDNSIIRTYSEYLDVDGSFSSNHTKAGIEILDRGSGELVSSYTTKEDDYVRKDVLEDFFVDNDGSIYASDYGNLSVGHEEESNIRVFKIMNLDFSISFDKSYYAPGDQVQFSIETSLPEKEYFSDENNQIQLIIDGEKIPALYNGTLGDKSYWSASWNVPDDMSDQNLSFTIEAQQYNMETGVNTNFDVDIINTGGTGVSSNFTIPISSSLASITTLPQTGGGTMSMIFRSLSAAFVFISKHLKSIN